MEKLNETPGYTINTGGLRCGRSERSELDTKKIKGDSCVATPEIAKETTISWLNWHVEYHLVSV